MAFQRMETLAKTYLGFLPNEKDVPDWESRESYDTTKVVDESDTAESTKCVAQNPQVLEPCPLGVDGLAIIGPAASNTLKHTHEEHPGPVNVPDLDDEGVEMMALAQQIPSYDSKSTTTVNNEDMEIVPLAHGRPTGEDTLMMDHENFVESFDEDVNMSSIDVKSLVSPELGVWEEVQDPSTSLAIDGISNYVAAASVRTTIYELEKKQVFLENHNSALQSSLEEHVFKLENLKHVIAEKDNNYTEMQEEHVERGGLLNDALDRIQELRNLDTIAKARSIEIAAKLKAEKSEIEEELLERDGLLHDALDQIRQLRDDSEEAAAHSAEIASRLKDEKSEVEEESRQKSAELQLRIEEIRRDLAGTEAEIARLEIELQQARKRADKCSQLVADNIQKHAANLEKSESEHARVLAEKADTEWETIKAKDKQIAKLHDHVEESKETIKGLEWRAKDDRAKTRIILEKIVSNKEKQDAQMKEEIARLRAKLDEAREMVTAHENAHTEVAARISSLQVASNDLKQQLLEKLRAVEMELLAERDQAKRAAHIQIKLREELQKLMNANECTKAELQEAAARNIDLQATNENDEHRLLLKMQESPFIKELLAEHKHLEQQLLEQKDVVEAARLAEENYTSMVTLRSIEWRNINIELRAREKYNNVLQEQLKQHLSDMRQRLEVAESQKATELSQMRTEFTHAASHAVNDHLLQQARAWKTRIREDEQQHRALKECVQLMSDFESKLAAQATSHEDALRTQMQHAEVLQEDALCEQQDTTTEIAHRAERSTYQNDRSALEDNIRQETDEAMDRNLQDQVYSERMLEAQQREINDLCSVLEQRQADTEDAAEYCHAMERLRKELTKTHDNAWVEECFRHAWADAQTRRKATAALQEGCIRLRTDILWLANYFSQNCESIQQGGKPALGVYRETLRQDLSRRHGICHREEAGEAEYLQAPIASQLFYSILAVVEPQPDGQTSGLSGERKSQHCGGNGDPAADALSHFSERFFQPYREVCPDQQTVFDEDPESARPQELYAHMRKAVAQFQHFVQEAESLDVVFEPRLRYRNPYQDETRFIASAIENLRNVIGFDSRKFLFPALQSRITQRNLLEECRLEEDPSAEGKQFRVVWLTKSKVPS